MTRPERLARAEPRRFWHLDGPGWAALVLALATVALCTAGAFQTGTSWDENEHRRYGEITLDFYRTLGGARAAATDEMNYYGALHALVGAAAERLLPSLYWPSARHLATVLFGLIGFVYCVRLARLLAGPWAGFIAALLLATTPRWIGDAMFNPIDIPTGALFTAAVFYLARLAGSLESASRADWLRFGVAAGLTLAVRLIGILLLPFAALVIGAWALFAPRPRLAAIRAHGPRLLAGFALAAVATTVVTFAFWPRMLVEPWTGLLDTLAQTNSYPWPGAVLFQGAYHSGHDLPWSYLSVWFAITTPIATLLGLALAAAFRGRWLRLERDALLRAGIVAFAVLFPTVYATATHAVIYDGIRHFLFVLPPVTALAAAGWAAGLRAAAARRWLVGSLSVVLAALAAEPIVWYVRSHPYEYVYFNPLAGGLKQASHGYDTDYWGLSLRSAAEWLSQHRVEIIGADEPLVLSTNADWHLLTPWFDDPAKYRKAEKGTDFHVALLWYRLKPVGWELSPRPNKRKLVVEGQVPFWQIYVGPLAVAARMPKR